MALKVQYAIRCYKAGTNTVLTAVKHGTPIDVAVLVDDLRPDGEYVVPPDDENPDGEVRPLTRGIYAAYTNLLFDRQMLEVACIEQQLVSFAWNAPKTGWFRFSIAERFSPIIAFDHRDAMARSQTAARMQTAINQMFMANVVSVTVPGRDNKYLVSFVGRPNTDVPLLIDDRAYIGVTEQFKGEPRLMANLMPVCTFASNYQNGREALNAEYGIKSLGAFYSGPFAPGPGSALLELVRVRMIAKNTGPSATAIVDIWPDFADMDYPMDETLVMGNLRAVPPEYSQVAPSEIEAVPFSLQIAK